MIASVCLVTSLAGCQLGGSDEPAATGEVVIGADLELSGAMATIGKGYERALQLKVQQLNDSGAFGGRTVRLEIKDNRTDPAESLRNISDFTANPAINAIIMGGCSECVKGAVKTISDRKVPTVALASSKDVATPLAERRYVFKLGPNAADTAAALAAELSRQNLKKVALLRTSDSYGAEGAAALKDELQKLGIDDLVAEQQVKTTDTDVSQAVQRIVEEKPKAIVVWTTADQAILAANAAKANRFAGRLFFDAAAAGELFLNNAEPNAMDRATMIYTQTMVIDDVIATTPAKAARKQWFRDFTSRYGSYYGGSSFAADAVQLITDAAVRAGGSDGTVNHDGTRDIIETSQMDGLSGPIRFTPDNHSGLMPQALTVLAADGSRWRLSS